MWGEETPGRIAFKFCWVIGTQNVITCIKFGHDRLRGFWSAGCQNLPFPRGSVALWSDKIYDVKIENLKHSLCSRWSFLARGKKVRCKNSIVWKFQEMPKGDGITRLSPTSFYTILIIGLSDHSGVVCYFSDTSPPLVGDFLSDFVFYRVFGNSNDWIWSESIGFSWWIN